jgi:hypothetical protein
MARHRTRRVRRSRKGGNLFGRLNPFGSKPGKVPNPEDTPFIQENPMVVKQQAQQLLQSVANKIAKIPLEVVATTNRTSPDKDAGWEQRAQAELKASVTAFAIATAKLIQKDPQTALATLQGLNNAPSDDMLWGMVKQNFPTGGRKPRNTKKVMRKRK